MKKFRFFSKLLFSLNILIAISTILAYSSPYVNPDSFWLLAFFGLGLPYLLLLNLFFFIYWLFRSSSRFVLSLIIVGLGYQYIPAYLQLSFENEEKLEKDIKIMSFNVRVFDLYMWTKEKTTRNQIFDFLKKEDPDVLCLQEFYHQDVRLPSYEFKTLDTLIKILTAKNYHVYYTSTLRENDHWGLITFSKFPIVEKGVVPFNQGNDNACIYSDLLVNNRNIRIYNTHLASIKLEKRDYKTMQNLNNKDYSNGFSKAWLLLEKVKGGFQRRASQALAVRASIDESPYPVVVCGDFNDTPTSFTYHTIKGKLNDAFTESGSGFGRTYIGEFPSFRIDYIFYDNTFTAKNYLTHPEELSDHHPVSTLLSMQK